MMLVQHRVAYKICIMMRSLILVWIFPPWKWSFTVHSKYLALFQESIGQTLIFKVNKNCNFYIYYRLLVSLLLQHYSHQLCSLINFSCYKFSFLDSHKQYTRTRRAELVIARETANGCNSEKWMKFITEMILWN